MEKNLILCDSNIIIEVLRNNKDIINKLHEISIDKIAVSIITVGGAYLGS